MNARAAFDAALEAARLWHETLPETRDFCAWPTDVEWAAREPHYLSAANLIKCDPGHFSPQSAALCAALQDLSPYVEWRHSYTADEVGQDFLDRFGWFELVGPKGHFHTSQARITVGYWGPDLFYPRHHHEPEELYTVVSGKALFHADKEPDQTLSAGDTRLHLSNQPHAMTTQESAVLTLVFWRGDDLASPLKLTQ